MKTNVLRRIVCGMVCAMGLALLAPAAPAQTLYAVNSSPGSVTEFTTAGKQSTFVPSGLYGSWCLAFNSAGDLFAADRDNGVITEVTPGGSESTFATGLDIPLGMAFNSAGDLLVANAGAKAGASNIVEYTSQGTQSVFASGLDPYGLAFDSAGNLYVSSDNSIIKITPQGAQSTFASGLNYPMDLAFNSAGDLFVAEEFGGGIVEITPGGAQSVFASVPYPEGLAFNNAGDLFTIVGDNYGTNTESIIEIAPDKTETVIDANAGYDTALAFSGTLPVPEPATASLLAGGAVLGWGLRYRGVRRVK